MASIGKIDFILAKAQLGLEMKATKPIIILEHSIEITEGRHPIVEENLKKKNLKFTPPIDIDLQEGISCITGANMGGQNR